MFNSTSFIEAEAVMLIIHHFLLQTICVTALKIFLTRALFTAALDIMRYAAFVHDNVLESV